MSIIMHGNHFVPLFSPCVRNRVTELSTDIIILQKFSICMLQKSIQERQIIDVADNNYPA